MLSSGENVDRQQQQQQQQQQVHHHYNNSSKTAVASQTMNPVRKVSHNGTSHGNNNGSSATTTSYNSSMRRKSTLSYHHQQTLLNAGSDNILQPCSAVSSSGHHNQLTSGSGSGGGGRYSPHPHDIFMQHNSKLSLQPITDDTLSCCLPPPSPAPHNDRFTGHTHASSTTNNCGDDPDCYISNNQSQQQHHHHHNHQHLHQQQQHHHHAQQSLSTSTSTSSLSTNSGICGLQSQHHHHGGSKYSISNTSRPLSPSSCSSSNNRYRTSNERFRESRNLIDSNTLLRTGDAYDYLNSTTAHTPVKRYVPTPPPPIHENIDGNCTLPYRLRMKCCSTMDPATDMAQITNEQRTHAVTDYYTTSPRSRSTGSSSNYNNSKPGKDPPAHFIAQDHAEHQPIVNSTRSNSQKISVVQSIAPPASSVLSSYQLGTCNRQPANGRIDYNNRSSNSIDYNVNNTNLSGSNNNSSNSNSITNAANNSRMISPVLVTSNVAGNQNSNGGVVDAISSNTNAAIAATCLHCNTTRRTTGVHQTTQTTGPISPIPLQQKQQISIGTSNNSQCITDQSVVTSTTSPSPITPSTSDTALSPISSMACNSIATTTQFEIQQQLRMQQGQSQSPTHQVHDSHLTENSDSNSFNCQQSPQHPHPQPHHQQQQQQLVSNQQTPPISSSTTSTTIGVTQSQRFNIQATRKKRLSQYLQREVASFFGVESSNEAEEYALWNGRQRRFALRRFGALKTDREIQQQQQQHQQHPLSVDNTNHDQQDSHYAHNNHHHATSDRPDILQITTASGNFDISENAGQNSNKLHDFQPGDFVERRASVASMFSAGITYIIGALSYNARYHKTPHQWSRSFAPLHVRQPNNNCFTNSSSNANGDEHDDDDFYEGLTALQNDEVFFDFPSSTENLNNIGFTQSINDNSPVGQTATAIRNYTRPNSNHNEQQAQQQQQQQQQQRHQIFVGERAHGWRTTSIMGGVGNSNVAQDNILLQQQHQQSTTQQTSQQQQPTVQIMPGSVRCQRISAQLLDGVLENSRRPLITRRHTYSSSKNRKLFEINDIDDRTDYRPFFTYWINTVQILVLFLSLICYGIGPIGFGVEQRTGQVLVTSLSLQTVQHTEQRNIWIGPRNFDLVHIGAKFATCMRRDVRIIDVLFKTRRQERETACCIRNDDSGCVQSSQADCSVRGLFPTKSISTWKKWSPGESGPGGRISGSVCGLDPKYCDAPASIAPYEWPDDITKWPICRKTNSFSQRFRFKDHTAEHMVCEVIGHPCCTGIYGECRITTREYCDFVNGYFHEEASLCSQISCLNNVCGMFPFFSVEVPDQFYRLFTSLCLHAGILHLAITVAFQHVFLADLERLIGSIRTAIVYIGSGVAGNLTSALLLPYKPEVGPLASLSGVVASLVVLLILMHWKHLRKPHMALLKLIFIGALLFGLGTLPWQLNFAGILAGIACGVFLTIALVPFVSVSIYSRKSKISLIWSCLLFHLFVYTFMLVIFYVFPTELTNLNFGDVLTNTFNTNMGNGGGGGNMNRNVGLGDSNGGHHHGTHIAIGADVLSSKNYQRYQPDDEFPTNNAAALQLNDNSRINTELFHNNLYNNINKKRFRSNHFLDSLEKTPTNFTYLQDIFLFNNIRKYNNNNSNSNNNFNKIKDYKNATRFTNINNNNKKTANHIAVYNASQLLLSAYQQRNEISANKQKKLQKIITKGTIITKGGTSQLLSTKEGYQENMPLQEQLIPASTAETPPQRQ